MSRLLCFVILFWCNLYYANATVCTWTGGTGNWNNASNWSCGKVPGPGDRVTIFTDNVDITVDINVIIDSFHLDGSNTRLIGDSSITVEKDMTWQYGIIEVDMSTEDLLIETNVFQSKFLYDTLIINGECEYDFINWLWIEEGGSLINHGNIHTDDGFLINSQGPRGTFINHGNFTKDGTGGSSSWLPITNYGTMNFLVGNFSRNEDFINHGTLRIDETMTGTNFSEFQNYGVLNGNGLIVLPTNYDLTNGIIAPGNSPGQLSFRNDGSVVYLEGEIHIEIENDQGIGIGHDHIDVVSPHAVLGGNLTVIENDSVPDGVYTIIQGNESCTGSFDSINLPPGYAINYTDTEFQLIKGGCVGDIDLTNTYLASDPHPSDFHAFQILTADGIVTSMEDLQFKTDSIIELYPEFTVEHDAGIEVHIVQCPQ